MSKLREKLRQQSEIELEGLIKQASALDGLHPAVTGEEIAGLAFSKRAKTLRKAVISRMINALEDEIAQKYSEQASITPDDDEGSL